MARQVVIIPALFPSEKLPTLCGRLFELGFKYITVIDDGSGEEFAPVFDSAEQLGCVVLHHEKNLGKGAAIKTGISDAVKRYGSGNTYITADADGQHLPEDILRVAEAGEDGALVLGIRDLSSPDVPPRSRFGNRATSFFFRLTTGVKCKDTQTGLRAVPPCLENLALTEDGERYEYELNFLASAAHRVRFKYIPITTVYEQGNASSHFRPIADSVRVYGRFLRYIVGSLSGAVADFLLYLLFSAVIPLPRIEVIFPAAALARIGSGTVNFLMNRYFAFRSKSKAGGEALRYGILFVVQLCASAGLTALAALIIPIPTAIIKIIIDTLLFFLSYVVQKNWVFKKQL